MAPLSSETVKRVELLFPSDDREMVTRLLVTECGNNLPFLEALDCIALERFRYAALKLSEGRMEKLLNAVELAKQDWRDLLVAAEFAADVNAHSAWFPSA